MKSSVRSISKISPRTIKMEYVIGCDLGSQGIKVILVTAEGRLVERASVGYAIDYPHPTWAGHRYQPWTEAMCTAVEKVLCNHRGFTG